ncbi:MAG: T9SS type A sorting domain-containing protein [Calditrichia bacterium]|nr:T9SS type A sorting domain-containing protein [Calditrichia bacterium]
MLQGFTLTNGFSFGGGGGIMCNSTSSPTLKNLNITSNIGGVGGGVFCFGATKPHLVEVILKNNSAINSGGGIYCENNAEVRLERVTISANVSNQDGGGIYLKNNARANLIDVTVEGNTSVSFGAGLYCVTNCTLNLENVMIMLNECEQDGGGIYLSDSCEATLLQDTLISNIAGSGGGIYCEKNSNLTVSSSLIEDNVVDFFGGGVYLQESNSIFNGCSLLRNSAMEGGGIYYEINATVNFSNGIISGNDAENWGGGIYCDGSNTILTGVNVLNNTASLGGGIFSGWNESSTFTDVTVSGNKAHTNGGGISLLESTLDVENVQIHSNQALESGGGIHFDISKVNFSMQNLSNIYLNYAGFFGNDLYADNSELIAVLVDTFTVKNPTDYQAYPFNNFAYNIHNGRVQQVAADLYVSPQGNDANSGLSAAEALNTIALALTKISADSLNPQTIYLAGGEYSPSKSSQIFPLNMARYVSLIGDSAINVPNGDGESSILNAEGESNVLIFNQDPGTDLKYLKITGGSAEYGGGIFCRESSPQLFRVTIFGNSATYGGGIYATSNSQPFLLNTTITENTVDEGGAIYCSKAKPILVNTILWENTPQEIFFEQSTDTSLIIITHSDIKDSLDGIVTNNSGSVEWLEGNTNKDPKFFNALEGDFTLKDDTSPCIDTGIHSQILFYNKGLDSLFIPELSIRGEKPDMGAFEFPIINGIANKKGLLKSFALYQNYPNPFNPKTKIKFILPKQEKVKIEIFNTLGQKIITLVDKTYRAGQHEIDFNGNYISSGVYFYRIEAGNFHDVKKMTILR